MLIADACMLMSRKSAFPLRFRQAYISHRTTSQISADLAWKPKLDLSPGTASQSNRSAVVIALEADAALRQMVRSQNSDEPIRLITF